MLIGINGETSEVQGPMREILTLYESDNTLPLVFDSPHSGSEYPESFDYACDLAILRTSEDRYVDELFENAKKHGAAFLAANFPRCFIDVNRAIDDIDPQLLEKNTDALNMNPTARSDAGIGLIWRLAKPGSPIYNKHLTPLEITERIEAFYKPYHDILERIIDDAHYKFGEVWHINCHSMPAASATPKKAITLAGHKPQQADFCLGNRDGTSCEQGFVREMRSFLQDLGYHVTINDPFKGVELVDRHSDPARGRHSVQVEINRALYMNEETGEKNKNYNALKADIDKLIHFCADYVQANLTSKAAD